ncbi:MAG: OmpA family protein [Candidatus Alcyoniella australis]|nr:OmpA family protein [Candidatus Alcyoniella australis]
MSRGRSLCAISLLAGLAVLLCSCGGSRYVDQLDALKIRLDYASSQNGRWCGPSDFASAETHLRYVEITLTNRDFVTAEDHLNKARDALDRLEPELGCDSDIDGDGTSDSADGAPFEAEDIDGFLDDDGVPDPDNDGDGIPDEIDGDPNRAEDYDGYQDTDGVPDLDNDGDGVPDKLDLAPMLPEDLDGFQDTDGVPDPDNDGDGFLDSEDYCPNEPEIYNGYLDDDGCPDVIPTISKIIVVGKVGFTGHNDRLTRSSKRNLDQFAQVLADNPEIRVRIEGHTADRGDAARNREFSQLQADAVRRYLIEQGVTPERLIAIGFGGTKPIASNSSSSGRSRNRRIEFIFMQ